VTTRRSRASALAHTLALLGLVMVAGCPGRAKAERKGPFLSIVRRHGASVPRSGVPPGSIALALGGLPPEALPRLRERLEESTDTALRRVTETLFDEAGLTPDAAAPAPDPLRQALADLPALTAATNVLGAPWSGPGLSVEVGPVCDTAASRCVPLFVPGADGEDDLARHGRALAWALGNAAVLRVVAGSRAATLRSLRGAQAGAAHTIALVFDAPRGTLDEAELALLHAQARRGLAHLAPDAPQRPWLEALVATRASWELPIALDPDEVLVVPRLGVLARLQDFRSEVERLYAGRD
jgi:hypothetical protein